MCYVMHLLFIWQPVQRFSSYLYRYEGRRQREGTRRAGSYSSIYRLTDGKREIIEKGDEEYQNDSFSNSFYDTFSLLCTWRRSYLCRVYSSFFYPNLYCSNLSFKSKLEGKRNPDYHLCTNDFYIAFHNKPDTVQTKY